MDDLIPKQAVIIEIARWIGHLDEDMIYKIQTELKMQKERNNHERIA